MKEETPLGRFVSEFAESRLALAGLCLFVVIALLAIFASLIAPQNPYDLAQLDIMDGRLPPGSKSEVGYTYILGTDDQGRDMFSGMLYGLRISLLVGVGSALFAAVVGTSLGLLSAWVGGRTDSAIMRLVDLQLSFPAILVALMILAVLGKGVLNVVLALVIVGNGPITRARYAPPRWSNASVSISRPRRASALPRMAYHSTGIYCRIACRR